MVNSSNLCLFLSILIVLKNVKTVCTCLVFVMNAIESKWVELILGVALAIFGHVRYVWFCLELFKRAELGLSPVLHGGVIFYLSY